MAIPIISTVQHADGADLNATSQRALLPVQNLQDDQITRVWRTQSGVNSVSLLVSFDGPRYVDGICLVNTNLTSVGTIRWRVGANPTMSVGVVYDSGVEQVRVSPYYRTVLSLTPDTPGTVQGLYVLIDLVDVSLNHIEAGRLWVGQVWAFSVNHKPGHKEGYPDLTKQDIAESGHIWIQKYPVSRRFSVTFDTVFEDEYYDHLAELAYNVGRHTPVLISLDPDPDTVAIKTLWGIMTTDVEVTSKAAVNAPSNAYQALYSLSLTVVEQQ
jgi:hypothetical protein